MAAFVGLAFLAGPLVSPTDITNAGIAVGQGLQTVGALGALIAGAIATRDHGTKHAGRRIHAS